MSPTKFYHVIQIILYMCSCDQSLVTVAFLWEKISQPQFYKDLTRKTTFFEVQVQEFGTGTRYKLEILRQCGTRVRTKSQKVLGSNSYVCRSYRGKTGTGDRFAPTHHPRTPILNRIKGTYLEHCLRFFLKK